MDAAYNDGRAVWIDRITAQLGTWVSQVEIAIKNNLPNINVLSETITAGVLNRMYGWKLVNANSRAQNFPGVDLVDEDECIAVQVTSTNSVEKVDNTLEKFFGHHLDERFDKVLIVVITNQNSTNGMKKRRHEPWFVGDSDIWNIPALLRKMEDLDAAVLEDISGFLAKELGLNGSARKPRHLLPGVPAPSPSFVEGSRDRELEQLERALKQGPVFLWGLGGIGKTETAIQLARRRAEGAYFLHYYHDAPDGVEALRETILRADFAGYRFDGRDNENRDLEYRERMDILRTEYAGAMVIIDNFDRPGRTLADLRGEQAYRDLTAMDLRLVFTTRNEVSPGGVEIKPLTEEDLLKLMRQSCTSRAVSDEDLLALIHAVEGHTLMADLMAKTLRESWGGVTARGMLDALKNSELDQTDFPEVVADRNREERQRRLYAHLKALFDLSGMGEENKAILRCATLLPEDGMQDRLFMECLPKEQRQPLRNLTKRGWLRHGGDKLTIHPVIREVCRAELKPMDESCEDFLLRLWDQYDPNGAYDAQWFLEMAKCFSMASDKLEDTTGHWACFAGRLWNELGQVQTALSYDLRMADRIERNLSMKSDALATAYNNVGITYGDLGDHGKALEYKEKALAIWEKVLPPDHPDLAASYNNVGITYSALGDHRKALEYHEKALAIWEKVLPPDHPDLAASYNNVGITYSALGDHGKALEYLEKALAIRERVLPPEHPDLARSYNNVGVIYAYQGNYAQVLAYLEKALAIYEKALPPSHPDIASTRESIDIVRSWM